jgi:hypothetical protein
MSFTIGQLYTRQQIHQQVGGDTRSYLPQKNNTISQK